MPVFRFPFVWGPNTAELPPVPSITTPVWTNVAGAAHAWQAGRAGVLPRFQHLYPQESNPTLNWVKKVSP